MPPSLRYPWYVVFVLMLAYVSSFIDRQILNLLVGPLKRDFHLSDTKVSLLMGLSFALFYTLLGIPVARWADRAPRRRIIVLGVALWSLMTALCGVVKTYGQFFLARVGVGVGEASLSPAAYSIITDYFPKEKLATAISVYSVGAFLGSGLAVLLGASLVSLPAETTTVVLPLVGEVFSWQLLFFYVGLPGAVIVLLLFTIKEPARRGALVHDGKTQAVSLRDAFGHIGQQRRVFFSVTLGITFVSLVAFGANAWIPTHFVRTFGWPIGKIGFSFGLIITVFSTAGVLTGGWLADFLTRRGYPDGKVRVGLIASAGLLLSAFFPLVPSPEVALGLCTLPCFFCAFPLGASSAAVQELVPNQVRALAAAVYLFILNLIALGFGPTLVALLTDYVFRDESAIRFSLATLTVVGSVLGLVSYGAGLGPHRRKQVEPAKVG